MSWKSQEFTVSGTFTPDANVTLVYATPVGAGGGGAGGSAGGCNASGGGGAASERVVKVPVPVTPGVGIPVTIGAPGAGGAANGLPPGNAGAPGGDTSFGALASRGGLGGSPQATNSSVGRGARGGGLWRRDHQRGDWFNRRQRGARGKVLLGRWIGWHRQQFVRRRRWRLRAGIRRRPGRRGNVRRHMRRRRRRSVDGVRPGGRGRRRRRQQIDQFHAGAGACGECVRRWRWRRRFANVQRSSVRWRSGRGRLLPGGVARTVTVRIPLVRVAGKIIDLPSTDAIVGAPAGATGATGATGPAGANGTNGTNGTNGANGTNGTNGANALIYETNFGDGVSTSYTITHNLGTLDVIAAFRVVSTGVVQSYAWTAATINTITVTVSPAPASNSQRAVVMTVNGASPAACVKLGKVVTSGSQSTITFSSIPGTYSDLMIIFSGRDTAVTGENTARIQFNGDATAANYSASQFVQGIGTFAGANTVASSANGGCFGGIPGTSGNANALGAAQIVIPNYAGTVFQKIVRSAYLDYYGSGPSFDTAAIGFMWKSTAAITSIKLTAGGTAWVDGTTATLYGLG